MNIRKVCGNLWNTEKGLSVIGPDIQGHDLIADLPPGSVLDLDSGTVTSEGGPRITFFVEEIEGVKAHVARHVRVMSQVTQRVSVVGG
jgi:hypothetical protein